MSVSSNYPANQSPSGMGYSIAEPTVNSTSSPVEGGFVDRRAPADPHDDRGFERRQFGSSHCDLSPDARELALAIDQYKLDHRRRYITCEEMLLVIRQLGYSRS